MLAMHPSVQIRFFVLTCALGLGAVAVLAQDAARGATLLGQAQQALGGANRLASVKTLQVTGTFRRVVGTNDTDGDFEVFIELPDSQGTAPRGSGVSYLRSEKTGTPGQPSTETIEALVAGQPLDAVRGGRGGGGGGPIGGGGGDAPAPDAAPEPAPAAPVDGAAAPAAPAAGGRGRGGADPNALARQRQADVSRLLVMWLLRSDTPLAWVGIAESPDGKADVLEARYADGQPTRLFLEAASHMPLMLQWQAVPAGRGGAGRGGARGGRGQGQVVTPGVVLPEGGGRQAGPPAPGQPVTMDMTFSDHREVNGIRLPHVITRGTNGMTTERWTISRYRVNPSFNADTFTR